MGKINDYAVGLAETYERNHPGCTWEEAMDAVCGTERKEVKGYPVEAGYMGFIDGRYRLFCTENEYYEVLYS